MIGMGSGLLKTSNKGRRAELGGTHSVSLYLLEALEMIITNTLKTKMEKTQVLSSSDYSVAFIKTLGTI